MTLKISQAQKTFSIRENTLCAELRMSEDELRARRAYFLVQGQHWDYVKKRVLLSTVGAQILRGTRDADLPKNAPAPDPAPKKAPLALLPEKNPAPVEFAGKLIAWGMPGRNERLLVCYLPETDPSNPLNLVSLLVRSNKNFLRGMEIPGKDGPGATVAVKRTGESTYELLGQCPRWRGRW